MRKLLIGLIGVFALASPLYAQNASSTGGEFSGLRNTVKQYHVTANTTLNVSTQTSKLYSVVVNVSNAGTTWAWTVAAVSAGNQGAAANAVNAWTAVTNSGLPTVLVGPPTPGILMQGGINITFTGTAGAADVWIAYK